MERDNSIKKNLGLQTIYQVLNTIMPLATAPYLARVLGSEKLGIFSFTSSVVSYFILFAMLGTENYGTRSIAAVKDNKKQISNVFSGIFTLQFLMSGIALVAYVIYLIWFCKDNKIIALIQGIAVLSCFFDINWLYFGVEDFQLPVIRSIVIKILTVASIFLFVKSINDLWLYTLLMLGGTLISQMVLWARVGNIIHFLVPTMANVVSHIKPNIVLFIPLLAMSVYHAMDKTMLGVLSTYTQGGLYYNSDKVVNIPFCVLTGVGTVMLPRMTALISKGKTNEANSLFLLSLDGISFLSIAMCFGISAIAKDFIPVFFGKGYEECIGLTISLSVVIVIKGISNTVRTQYLVPLGYEKVFTHSVFAGAIVNLFINFLLIPGYGAMGAVVGTIIAELVSCIWQMFFVCDKVSLKNFYLNIFVYVIIGTCMFFIVHSLSTLTMPVVLKLIIEIIFGGSFYVLIAVAFWTITKNKLLKIILRMN